MNNTLFLLRHSKSPYGAFGVLLNFNCIPFATSLENEETLLSQSSGVFRCDKSFYHKGGYPTFEIIVPGRSRILFHKLNWDKQSEGCVGIGESYEVIEGIPGIAQSDKGFTEFWKLYGGFDKIDLVVVDHLIYPNYKNVLPRIS